MKLPESEQSWLDGLEFGRALSAQAISGDTAVWTGILMVGPYEIGWACHHRHRRPEAALGCAQDARVIMRQSFRALPEDLANRLRAPQEARIWNALLVDPRLQADPESRQWMEDHNVRETAAYWTRLAAQPLA